ncbi:MAG: hypothetical protein EON98_08855 [Chitinophagaceae bacterium]|nr:MAG: hypothetical protein EON98_08855 [Chitinophagaceae bacterium]
MLPVASNVRCTVCPTVLRV